MSKKSKTSDPVVVGEPKITRDDIEAKFRHITGDANDKAQSMTKVAVAGGSALVMALIILFFLLGRSKGQKRTTVVEIVRV